MTRQDKSVAFLLGNLTVGGSETKIVRLANRLAMQGYAVHILAIGPPYDLREQINAKVAVQCFDRKFKFSIRILLKIKEYLEKSRIHTIVCINPYPLVYGWPACFLMGRKKCHCISSINTSEFVSVRDKIFMPVYGFILRRCDRVVFGCRQQAATWMERYRIARDKAVVIYNGVDTDYFLPGQARHSDVREELVIGSDSSVIGCVAQFRPEKSHRNLLEALDRLVRNHRMDIVLILVGDGPEEEALRDFVSRKNLDSHVRFVGKVADVRPYVSLFDVFVMPSVAVEVFSNAMLEAIAMGIPVISSDVGGASEMIEHGKQGFVYPRHDVGLLTEYMRRLVSDSELANRFRLSAEKRLRSDFTIERMDREYAGVIWGNDVA